MCGHGFSSCLCFCYMTASSPPLSRSSAFYNVKTTRKTLIRGKCFDFILSSFQNGKTVHPLWIIQAMLFYYGSIKQYATPGKVPGTPGSAQKWQHLLFVLPLPWDGCPGPGAAGVGWLPQAARRPPERNTVYPHLLWLSLGCHSVLGSGAPDLSCSEDYGAVPKLWEEEWSDGEDGK